MKLLVYVFRRPNMFAVNENMYNMVGTYELKNLYTIEGYKAEDKKLTLFYPERFLNVIEIRCLIKRLENAGYEDVQITTNSEHLLTTVYKENIRIVMDDLIMEGEGRFKLSNDYVGMPDDDGLGVLFGGL